MITGTRASVELIQAWRKSNQAGGLVLLDSTGALPSSLGGVGEKGDKGDQGETGLQGPKGDPGPAGADGGLSPHTHAISDITNLQAELDFKSEPGHTHTISDTTGLQTALDGKAPTSHSHDEFVPAGGTTAQVLAKASDTDFDLEWVTPSSGSGASFVDGGTPSSIYGGTDPIDGGTP